MLDYNIYEGYSANLNICFQHLISLFRILCEQKCEEKIYIYFGTDSLPFFIV